MPTEREVARSLLDHAPERLRDLLDKAGVADPKCAEPMIVACGSDHFGITGSKRVVCGLCRAAAWISPSTQELLAQRGDRPTVLLCVHCMLAKMKEMK